MNYESEATATKGYLFMPLWVPLKQTIPAVRLVPISESSLMKKQKVKLERIWPGKRASNTRAYETHTSQVYICLRYSAGLMFVQRLKALVKAD